MPESFFVLSKEHLELAIDEVISIAKTYDRFSKFKIFSNVIIVQSSIPLEKISSRASYVKISGKVLKKLSNLFLDQENFLALMNAKTFACRVIDISNKRKPIEELEIVMGNMISKFSKAKVDLRNPEIIIYLIIDKSYKFFGFSMNIKNIKIPIKPLKHPHELDRKLCRVMVNLLGLKEGSTLCDPFCGTGTILLEAENIGIKTIGIDYDKKMCVITKKNTKANNFNSKIINADYSYLKILENSYDGVVTDIPYGRGSKKTKPPQMILSDLINCIPKKKKFVIMCKKGLEDKVKNNFSKIYQIYRHKNLTRIILVK